MLSFGYSKILLFITYHYYGKGFLFALIIWCLEFLIFHVLEIFLEIRNSIVGGLVEYNGTANYCISIGLFCNKNLIHSFMVSSLPNKRRRRKKKRNHQTTNKGNLFRYWLREFCNKNSICMWFSYCQ